jgi:hypothetical protein
MYVHPTIVYCLQIYGIDETAWTAEASIIFRPSRTRPPERFEEIRGAHGLRNLSRKRGAAIETVS